MDIKERRFFYGWVIVGVGFLVNFAIGGCVFYSFGIFLKPMIADLDCMRGEANIAFSIMMTMQFMIGPVVAVALSKFGTRRVLLAGTVMMVIGLLLLSRVTQLWHLWLVFGVVIGIGMAFGTFLPTVTMVNFWFVRRRSLAMGIVVSGVGVGTLILAPVIAYLIDSVGWRTSWLVLSGVMLAFAVIPPLIFARNRPEDVGQLPDGVATIESTKQDIAPLRKRVYVTPVEWEPRAALKTPALWLLAVSGGANMFALNMLSAHQVAHLTDMGIPSLVAAGALGILVGVSTLGRLTGGVLGDRIEPRYLIAMACLMQVIALIIFTNAQTMMWVYMYVLLFGLACGAILVLQPVIMAAYYGAKAFARLQAIVMFIFAPILASSPILGGYVYDAVHSYTIPFSVCAGFCAVGVICAFLARPPKALNPYLNPDNSIGKVN